MDVLQIDPTSIDRRDQVRTLLVWTRAPPEIDGTAAGADEGPAWAGGTPRAHRPTVGSVLGPGGGAGIAAPVTSSPRWSIGGHAENAACA